MSRSNIIKLNPIWPAWVVSWLSRSLPPSQNLLPVSYAAGAGGNVWWLNSSHLSTFDSFLWSQELPVKWRMGSARTYGVTAIVRFQGPQGSF